MENALKLMMRGKELPAVSPYSPKVGQQKSKVSVAAVLAVFLFVIRYWKRAFGNKNNPNNDGRIVTQPLSWLSSSSLVFRSTLLDLFASSITNFRIQNSNVDNIGKNCRAIQSVLNYWFGQYKPDLSQKKLWMIVSSSSQYREKVDAEIATKFGSILQDLSSSSSSSSFSDTKTNCSSIWQEWCHDPDKIYGAKGKIAAIIVLDQFSRHILRHQEVIMKRQLNEDQIIDADNAIKNDRCTILHAKDCFDSLALETAQLFIREHSAEIDSGMIPIPMQIFSLMPYRHAGKIENIQYVQQKVEEMASLQEQNDAMIGRFRKATNRRMAVLQDEKRRKGNTDIKITMTGDNWNDGACASTGTDKKKTDYTDEDILETIHFDADLTAAVQHPIHRTLVDFLSEQGIHPKKSKLNGKGSNTVGDGASDTSDKTEDAIMVSLSGGVDSMVVVSVLAYLKRSCGYKHLLIHAVHIDYANRPESRAEADYVRRYCEEILGTNVIKFTCRRIGEVTRGITARDDYERIAREIRYDSYRDAVMGAKIEMGTCSKEEETDKIVGVVLGHHRGDLRENVLSNAHKGCGPLDLSGMTKVSKNDGITIFRPLLPLEKSLVLDYAHKFGVPYFKDTTPNWSTRGKLRNKLLPLLEEIYGDGSMNNLSNLAVESDDCRALMYSSMIRPFLDSVVRKPMGIIIDTVQWKSQPTFFWKVVLRETLHSVGLGMFSDKSVLAFLQRIRSKKLKAAWLQCRKDYGVYLQEDGKVFVLYPSSFPWNKKDAYGLDGHNIEFGSENFAGPWTIKADIASGSSHQDSSQLPGIWLSKKAVLSMESFMDGCVEYFISAPTWFDKHHDNFIPRPLVFRQFSKTYRPRAWKNCDLKIQKTIPVLGNGPITKKYDATSGSDFTQELDDEIKTNPERLIRISIQLTESGGY